MKQLMKGNEAMAEAAVMAGCRYYFGYPITPQNGEACSLCATPFMPRHDAGELHQ